MNDFSSWFFSLSFAAILAVCSSPSHAQTISLSDGGLDFRGNRIVEVLFNTGPVGGAAAIEIGAIAGSSTTFVSGSVTMTGEGGGGVETAIPALNPFTLMPQNDGLSVDTVAGVSFFAFGTGILAGSSSQLLKTLTFAGPNATVQIVGSYNIAGDYSNLLPGSHGIVSESDGSTPVSILGTFGAGGGGIDYQPGLVTYNFPATSGGGGFVPGDYNADGNVDGIDYAVWRENLGLDSSALNGNGTGSPIVGTADFSLWRFQRSNTLPVPTSIPEPSSGGLLVVTLLAFAGASRRRSSGDR